MSKGKPTTTSVPTQQTNSSHRPQSGLDWNTPKTARTPRSEYRFMRDYATVWTQTPNGGSFGGFNGGVAQ